MDASDTVGNVAAAGPVAAVGPVTGDAGQLDPGDVAVVNVPGEHADRRRRPLTGITVRGPADQPGEPVEGAVEGLPVLEVGALADCLREPAAPAGPVGG